MPETSTLKREEQNNDAGHDKAADALDYNEDLHAEVPEDLQIGEHGYKYRIVDGRVMPPYITPRCYGLSRRIETRPTDICFVSYPKSGTTWLSYIIVLLTGNAGPSLERSFCWLESSWTHPINEDELGSDPKPRLFKSHMPYDMALGGVPHQSPCKYIYIARNPKDVCSSYYYFESNKSWSGFYDGGWDHWLQMFQDGKVHRGDWFHHVLSWWEYRDADNILFLHYEHLKRNTRAELEKIAKFLGLDIPLERMDEIEGSIGFSAMKNTEFSAMKGVKEFGKFFRKGEIGSWKEYFTVAQNDRFDALYQQRVDSSGIDFIFE
ncbi:hypothetical protein HIM_05984 [Hirsutella minnesotensis 3608]|uniref:Sulfotransferase domain-containing protein n=1 Tax=Hirsutella minnesotensis 3608 TaxID=1043627 RepID=A0A0F8A534_9HYPO|nr:hypothetical protein HIM_05984 [Hirsutella minnesotensis 3608]